MPATVEARGLVKRFGKVDALTGLDLVAASGQVTALLGPNGAGKTTFVRLVATLLRPDAGELHVAGIDAGADPRRVRRVIGLAGQSASVEAAMTGRENLEFVGRLFGLGRRDARLAAASVLEQLDLTDAADRLVGLASLVVLPLMLGGTGPAGIGHSTSYWVLLGLLWCAGILGAFATVAVVRFSRAQ